MRISIPLLPSRPRSAVEDTAARLSTSPAEVLRRVRRRAIGPRERLRYQAVSLLLEYPTPELLERLPVIRDAIAGDRLAVPLLGLIGHLERLEHRAAQEAYVDTFDLRRRCCLYLTYYGYGDTRRRGLALLDLKQVYRACGAELGEDELPDHLAVVLEFAATVAPEVGQVILADHRGALEMLRIALLDRSSPYAAALDVICATLPPISEGKREAMLALLRSGPPTEQVGDGFGAGFGTDYGAALASARLENATTARGAVR